jgi:hypothetical protein
MATLEVSWARWKAKGLPVHDVKDVILARKGDVLATGAADGSVWLWNINREPAAAVDSPPTTIVPYVALLGHGSSIIGLIETKYSWTYAPDEDDVLISVSEDG